MLLELKSVKISMDGYKPAITSHSARPTQNTYATTTADDSYEAHQLAFRLREKGMNVVQLVHLYAGANGVDETGAQEHAHLYHATWWTFMDADAGSFSCRRCACVPMLATASAHVRAVCTHSETQGFSRHAAM